GYDRIEGGGRANVGVQYTLSLANGAFANVMIGQSYHLFGKNSFAENDNLQTGEGTGLEQDRSDYVASAYLKLTQELSFSTRFRLAEDDFSVKAAEVEAKLNKGPVLAGLTYGRYEAQPQLGLERVEGLVG